MSKNQLHQLLAVENDKKTKAKIILDETINTFVKKQEHFDGILKTYNSFDESGDQIPAEEKEIVTNVSNKVNYSLKAISDAIDVNLSKEETNSKIDAKAKLKVDGVDFGELSATSLLALESHLVKVREMYKAIPTLDPTKKWKNDTNKGKGYWETTSEIKFRTQKIPQTIVLAPATDKHPAQTSLVNVDKQVGQYETVYKSGRISVSQKSTLLERIDELINSVKIARSKANQVEVSNVSIANKLFRYINQDIL